MLDVMTREKEIRYSSRTRAGTDQFKYVQRLRHILADLMEKLPEDLKNSPEARLLGKEAQQKVYNIVQLIYRAKNYEGHSKDYEFSRLSMQEHWRAAVTMRAAHCGTARYLNARQITRACSPSISTGMVANKQASRSMPTQG